MTEERDIYIILVLLNCADFNNWQTNGWDGNPYNQARAGSSPLSWTQVKVSGAIDHGSF